MDRRLFLALVLAVIVASCRASYGGQRTTVIESAQPASPTAAALATAAPDTGSFATSSPSPVQRVPTTVTNPSAPAGQVTPEGTASSPPRPFVAASCCGLFSWAAPDWLLVYDRVPQAGAWLLNVVSGERRWLGAWFGVAAGDRVALVDPERGVTTILDWDGQVLGEVETGRALAVLSPDGRFLAWLQMNEERLPSSFLARIGTLVVLDTTTQRSYRLGEMRVTSLTWTGDSQRLLVLGESTDGSRAGVWVAEPPWTALRPILSGRFFVDLRVVPKSSSFLVTRVLSGVPNEDGVWLVDAATEHAQHVPIAPGYRASAGTIWELDNEGAARRLRAYRLETLHLCAATDLAEPVLADTWEVSPDGHWVAYWAASSQEVRVEKLPACSE